MRALIDKALAQLRAFFGKMTKKEKIRLFILVVLIIALAIVAVVLLGQKKYVDLYTNLPSGEAGKILGALDEMGVPYRTPSPGVIQVPEGTEVDVKMRLDAAGYNSSELDLSILQSGSGFSTTDAERRTLYQYQTQEEIRGLLLNSSKVKSAKVKLTLGDEPTYFFSPDLTVAKCGVSLELTGDTKLTKAESNALIELIMSCVPGLKPENIRMTDKNLNLYMLDSELTTDELNEEIMFRVALEESTMRKMEELIWQLLAPIFGPNGFRVSVYTRLNFDSEKSHSVEFSPPVAGEDQGMIRSMEEMYKTSREDAGAEGIPGTDTNGAGSTEYPYGTAEDGVLWSEQLNQTNFEMNEVTTDIERAKGDIEYLSIGIVIDSATFSEDYSAQVQEVVAGAVGAKPEYVKVERFPFVQAEETDEADPERQMFEAIKQRQMLQEIIRLAVWFLLGIAFLWLVYSIVKMLAPKPEPQPIMAGAIGPDGSLDMLVGLDDLDIEDFDGIGGSMPDSGLGALAKDEDDELSLYQDVEISAKLSGVVQLERFIEKDPKAVAQLLRNWLADD